MNAREHRQVLREIEREIQARLGEPPTLGGVQVSRQARWADAIRNAGKVLTLLTAEVIQAFAALVLLVFFALVELERLHTGAEALGQEAAAGLIAIGFTVGNALMPIYKLRRARAEGLKRRRWTVAGRGWALRDKWSGEETVEELEPSHNPALESADRLIFAGTFFLAAFAVLGPTMATVQGNWLEALLSVLGKDFATFSKLAGGLALSLGGVLALRAISHEVGVRTLTDAPPSAEAQHKTALIEFDQKAEAIRAEVWARYEEEPNPTQAPEPMYSAEVMAHLSSNGHAKMNGGGAGR